MAQNADSIYLSIVVPAYNEEKIISTTLQRLEAYQKIKGQPWEILIVNDGSADKTAAQVEEFIRSTGVSNVRLLSFEKNRGKGAVVRDGMLQARGQYVLLADADLAMPIKESDKLICQIDFGADIAIGSRALREDGLDSKQSMKRRISGRVFNLIVQALLLPGIHDTQCGFKCFRRETAQDLFASQKLDGFSFDVEILYLARKKKYKITEVPVMWRQGEKSSVSLFRDSLRMLKDLFRIKQLHR